MKILFKPLYFIHDLIARVFRGKPKDPQVDINEIAETIGELTAIDPEKLRPVNHIPRRMKYIPFDTLSAIAKRKKLNRRR